MIIATEVICLKGQLFGRTKNSLTAVQGSLTNYKLPGKVYQQGTQATKDDFPFTCNNGGIIQIIADYSTKHITLIREDMTTESPQSISVEYYDADGYQQLDTFTEGTDYKSTDRYICLELTEYSKASDTIQITLNGTQNGAFSAFLSEGMVITNAELFDIELDANCDPTCTTLPSSKAIIRIKKSINLLWFEKYVEIQIRYRNKTHSFYVLSVDDTQAEYFELNCVDPIGVLGTLNFVGCAHSDTLDHYSSNNFIDYLTAYAFPVYTEKENFEIPGTNGFIKSGTLREALQQYLFGYQQWVRTDNKNGQIWVYQRESDGKVSADDSMLGGVYQQAEDLGKITLYGHRPHLESVSAIPLRTNWQANDYNNYYDETTKVAEESYGKGQEKQIQNATLVYNYYDGTTTALMKSLKAYLSRLSTYRGEIIYNGETLGDMLVVPTESGHVIGRLASYHLSFSSFILATIKLACDKKNQSGIYGDIMFDNDALAYTINVDLGIDSGLYFYCESEGNNLPISRIFTSSGKVYVNTTGLGQHEIYNGSKWVGGNSGTNSLELYATNWVNLPKDVINFLKNNTDLGIGDNDYIE